MIHNFSAGPSILPNEVLKQVQQELINYNGNGCSILELSHRSKDFTRVIDKAEQDLRQLLMIPDNYYVLFMQGGATNQFSSVYLNFEKGRRLDYIVTGTWSEKAMEEATKLGGNCHVLCNSNLEWNYVDDEADYLFYVSNETVHGFEFPDGVHQESFSFQDHLPTSYLKKVPIVCDMSSNILSKKIDVTKFGCIFAGAQKNIGPAGLTLVIVRKDLVRDVKAPVMLKYLTFSQSKSLYNTPPTFAIYFSGLVFEHLLQKTLLKQEEENKEKAKLIYDCIGQHSTVYQCCVKDSRYQSKMNVTWRIITNGQVDPIKEEAFLKGCQERNMIQLGGHRSVGGIRASIYNAMPISSVRVLVDWMHEFAQQSSL